MKAALLRLRDELGITGLGALALVVIAAASHHFMLRPMEERSLRLDQRLGQIARAPRQDLKTVAASDTPLSSFYEFFGRGERLEDWLARLYASALAADLQWRAAEYRLLDSRHGVGRYQISLPLSGSYRQIRAFVENALLEIPIMSVDQVRFRRKSVDDIRVEAEVVVTLYLAGR